MRTLFFDSNLYSVQSSAGGAATACRTYSPEVVGIARGARTDDRLTHPEASITPGTDTG